MNKILINQNNSLITKIEILNYYDDSIVEVDALTIVDEKINLVIRDKNIVTVFYEMTNFKEIRLHCAYNEIAQDTLKLFLTA